MQLRFFPLVFILGIACSNETAPAPNAAGALGGVQKSSPETAAPPAAEVAPAAETPPAAEPSHTRGSKAASGVVKKYEQTAQPIIDKLRG